MRGLRSPQKDQPLNAQKDTKGLFFLCLLWLILPVIFESGCRSNTPTADPEPGVSLDLATKRAQSIGSLSYDLSFTIPAKPTEPITGHALGLTTW